VGNVRMVAKMPSTSGTIVSQQMMDCGLHTAKITSKQGCFRGRFSRKELGLFFRLKKEQKAPHNTIK